MTHLNVEMKKGADKFIVCTLSYAWDLNGAEGPG